MTRVFNAIYVKNREKIIIVVFSLYCILIALGMLDISGWNDTYNIVLDILKLSILLFLLIYFITDVIKRKIKLSPIFIILFIFIFINFIITRNVNLLLLLYFSLILKDVNKKKLVNYLSLIISLFLFILFFLFLFGIVQSKLDHRVEGTFRLMIGFKNSVYPSILLFYIILMRFFVSNGKLPFFEKIYILIFTILFFIFTNTRSTFILSMLVLLLSVLLEFKFFEAFLKKISDFLKRKVVCNIVSLIPVFITVLMIILIIIYNLNLPYADVINSILSRRLEFANETFSQYGITLFGSYFSFGYAGVDIAYLNIILSAGVINAIIILFAYYKAIKYFINKNNIILTIILGFIIIDSIINSDLISYNYNVFSIFIFEILLNVFSFNELKSYKESLIKNNGTQEKITIIIPVYNGEKYIKRCLDSILSNKVDLKIIAINDASTDRSLEILNEYREKIEIINIKKNQGASNARNIGLSMVETKYVAFVDIDDYVEPNMYQTMLDAIIKDDSDVCVCEYNEVIENNNEIVNSKYKFDRNCFNKEESLKKYLTDKISPALWDKMFKTEVVKNLKFNKDLVVGEDILFVLKVFLKIDKLSTVSQKLYNYIQQGNSIMHTLSNKYLQFGEILKCLTKEENKVLEENFADEFEYFKTELITRSIHSISVNTNKTNINLARGMLKSICSKDNLKNIIKNEYTQKTIKLECMIIKIFGINMHLFLMPIYKWIRSTKTRND